MISGGAIGQRPGQSGVWGLTVRVFGIGPDPQPATTNHWAIGFWHRAPAHPPNFSRLELLVP